MFPEKINIFFNEEGEELQNLVQELLLEIYMENNRKVDMIKQ